MIIRFNNGSFSPVSSKHRFKSISELESFLFISPSSFDGESFICGNSPLSFLLREFAMFWKERRITNYNLVEWLNNFQLQSILKNSFHTCEPGNVHMTMC